MQGPLDNSERRFPYGALLAPTAKDMLADLTPSTVDRQDPQVQIDIDLAALQVHYGAGEYEKALKRGLAALRKTGRAPHRTGEVRSHVAEVLFRLGRMEAAERLARQALADSYRRGIAGPNELILLNTLGRIYRRRGALTLSIESYEQALDMIERQGGPAGQARASKQNLVLSLAPKGEFARARSLIQEIAAGPQPTIPWRIAIDHLQVARYAEHAGNWSLFAEKVRSAREYERECDYRTRVLISQFQAELDIRRGRASEAVPILERELAELQGRAPLGDMVPVTACLLARALFEEGRYEDALRHARVAARKGQRAEALEWVVSLRVSGECLAALGRRDSAAAAFGEAQLVHSTTEFVVEQARLRQTLERLGFPETAAFQQPHASTRRRARVVRVALSDDRTFLTNDLKLLSELRLAASDQLPVLLEGETGTGKELAARLLHEFGGADRPLVIIDCTSLPESLAEVELFGASRGAYTGAVSERRGLVSGAQGGTLFLDELPELPLRIQSMLLRVLQEGTYRRVGEDRQRKVSLRIVASTNRDVDSLLVAKRLKPDLFFRLNGHRIRLAPLRESAEAIEGLAMEFAAAAGLGGISREALSYLKSYSWPGNVRELEMFIRRVGLKQAQGTRLEEETVADYVRARPRLLDDAIPGALLQARREAERKALERAIEQHDGNMSSVARSLSMSRQALYKALKRTGLA